jgi:SAM-dependent methyltransferase
VDRQAWRLFDQLADEYDQELPFFARYGEAIVAGLAPQPGTRFLDLGAGAGALTAAALAHGCVVTAIDAAPGMVARLRANFAAATVFEMDAEALTLPSDSFDLVAAAFVVHLVERPEAVLAQAYRVLVPGGRFAFTGGTGGVGRPSEDGLADRLHALFGEFNQFLPPGGGMGRPIEPPDLLRGAGFVDLQQTRAESAVRVADPPTLWRWVRSHGYRAFLDDLPAPRYAEFEARLLALPLGDGILRRAATVWSGAKPTAGGPVEV